MTVRLFKIISSHLRRSSRKPKSAGFTLIELLIVTVIGSLVVSSLLVLMNTLLRTDQREYARTETQRDMKRALEYISGELRESVYVYDGEQLQDRPGLFNGIRDNIPNFGADVSPILAFWKVAPIPEDELNNLNCGGFTGDRERECGDLKIERRAYSLVVYLQSTANSAIWQGESRILRYELPKYADVSTLTRTTGYVDPASQSSFRDWPYDSSNTNLQATRPTDTNNAVALVDFVDAPGNAAGTLPTCETNYGRTPSDATNFQSFFACVRNPQVNQTDDVFNQDVQVFLRGNAKGQPGVISNAYLPAIDARVISRGVVNKRVTD
jgi:prepilin-type N-terminal cleavage/methylation domain-containing protein